MSSDHKSRKDGCRWIISVFIGSFFASGLFSFLSSLVLENAAMAFAFFLLLLIVLIGIAFDILGVAVTAADERPFHSMAARHVPGAREALKLLKNSARVSSFCNDVVGDICGVISGASAASIAARVIVNFTPGLSDLVTIGMSGLVAGLTVGGKAIGKRYAINYSTDIVRIAAVLIHWFKSIPELPKKLFQK